MGLYAQGDTPAIGIIVITPSDTVTNLDMRALYVGTTGDVSVVMQDGSAGVLKSVPAGVLLPMQAVQIRATGTTAKDLIGFK